MEIDPTKVSRVLRHLLEGYAVEMDGRWWRMKDGCLGWVQGPEDEKLFLVECSLMAFVQMAMTMSDDELFLLGAQSVMTREADKRARRRERSVAARRLAQR